MNIVQMSVQAAVMIAFIVIIRALAVGKLPKWSMQALWGVVIIRLLIPFHIESPLSAYGAVSAAGLMLTPLPPEPLPVIAAVENTVLSAGQNVVPAAANAAPDWAPSVSPFTIVWLSCAALLAAYFVLTHIRCRRVYAQSLPLKSTRAMGRHVSIRVSDRVSTPLTYGVLKPVILLPKQMALNGTSLRYVLTHELTHVRQLDAIKKWLLTAALCVHWFNPLVWVMFILASRDIELACDESVLRAFGDGAKASYASMLIDLMEQRGGLSPLVSHFSKNAIEERILSIMKHKKTSFISVMAALLLLAFTTVALATSAIPERPLEAAQAPTASAPTVPMTTAAPEMSQEATQTHIAYGSTTPDPVANAERYAPYAQYGLTYDAATDRLYYQGELVRYFEDMYPVDENASSGMLAQYSDGTAYVHGVRDLSNLKRNPDGSIDPSGVLIGVARYTEEEAEERMQHLNGRPFVSITDGGWWTADEFEQWLNEERVKLAGMVGQRGWTGQKGWFTWTQADVDQAIALYERQLEDMRNGVLYAKGVAVEDGPGYLFMAQGPNAYTNEKTTGVVEDIGTVYDSKGSNSADSIEVTTEVVEEIGSVYISKGSNSADSIEATTEVVENTGSNHRYNASSIPDVLNEDVLTNYAEGPSATPNATATIIDPIGAPTQPIQAGYSASITLPNGERYSFGGESKAELHEKVAQFLSDAVTLNVLSLEDAMELLNNYELTVATE